MRICHQIFTLIIAVVAFSVSAANISFLQDSAVSKMSKEDIQLLKSEIKSVLENGVDGKTQTWKSSQSDSHGSLTPLKSFDEKGYQCRTLVIVNKAGGEVGKSQFDLCKNKEGKWKVLR